MGMDAPGRRAHSFNRASIAVIIFGRAIYFFKSICGPPAPERGREISPASDRPKLTGPRVSSFRSLFIQNGAPPTAPADLGACAQNHDLSSESGPARQCQPARDYRCRWRSKLLLKIIKLARRYRPLALRITSHDPQSSYFRWAPPARIVVAACHTSLCRRNYQKPLADFIKLYPTVKGEQTRRSGSRHTHTHNADNPNFH